MITPLILSGPSGVGKTYLEKHLITNYNFKRILSTTTRPKRQNEENGVDYEFLTEEQYKNYEKAGAFVTSIHNLNAWYGIRRELVDEIIKEGKTPICVIVPQIIEKFIESYPNTSAVFLMPQNNDLLIRRMRLRGDTPEQIEKRLDQTLIEIELYQKLKHIYNQCLTVSETNFETIVDKIIKLIDQTQAVEARK